eukprot:TRINITY_DN54236_c0_g1_i1.p1 TRINITY_DN54236_c0_g1~~TRINITY_DN54236_c0_g1_i1.p1  ORF type:complete len:372 (-),score=83.25 TRINITY_DN54236_c0_g1_i1:250-1365(-)
MGANCCAGKRGGETWPLEPATQKPVEHEEDGDSGLKAPTLVDEKGGPKKNDEEKPTAFPAAEPSPSASADPTPPSGDAKPPESSPLAPSDPPSEKTSPPVAAAAPETVVAAAPETAPLGSEDQSTEKSSLPVAAAPSTGAPSDPPAPSADKSSTSDPTSHGEGGDTAQSVGDGLPPQEEFYIPPPAFVPMAAIPSDKSVSKKLPHDSPKSDAQASTAAPPSFDGQMSAKTSEVVDEPLPEHLAAVRLGSDIPEDDIPPPPVVPMGNIEVAERPGEADAGDEAMKSRRSLRKPTMPVESDDGTLRARLDANETMGGNAVDEAVDAEFEELMKNWQPRAARGKSVHNLEIDPGFQPTLAEDTQAPAPPAPEAS